MAGPGLAAHCQEALRRIRAGYTEQAVVAGPTTNTPTLIAYQFFGHPKLVLHRAPPG